MELVLIIIVVVIVSIISAAVKKKPKSSEQQDAPAPVRPTMSDIQRAFMMAAGMPDKDDAPYQPAPQPRPQPVAPSYARTSSAEFIQPIQPAVTESSMGGTSYEGMGPNTVELLNPYMGLQISKYYMDEEDEEQNLPNPRAGRQSPAASRVSLFENQQDIVKAIIYSEILPRRGRAPRFR